MLGCMKSDCASVWVCVCAYPLSNDCCNNRQQSYKVRGSLVNSVQTTSHKSPVTHSKWTRSWTPQPESPLQTPPYNIAPTPFILLKKIWFVSPQWLLCTFMIKWWEVVKCDGWLDRTSYEVSIQGEKNMQCLPMPFCQVVNLNDSNTSINTFT